MEFNRVDFPTLGLPIIEIKPDLHFLCGMALIITDICRCCDCYWGQLILMPGIKSQAPCTLCDSSSNTKNAEGNIKKYFKAEKEL